MQIHARILRCPRWWPRSAKQWSPPGRKARSVISTGSPCISGHSVLTSASDQGVAHAGLAPKNPSGRISWSTANLICNLSTPPEPTRGRSGPRNRPRHRRPDRRTAPGVDVRVIACELDDAGFALLQGALGPFSSRPAHPCAWRVPGWKESGCILSPEMLAKEPFRLVANRLRRGYTLVRRAAARLSKLLRLFVCAEGEGRTDWAPALAPVIMAPVGYCPWRPMGRSHREIALSASGAPGCHELDARLTGCLRSPTSFTIWPTSHGFWRSAEADRGRAAGKIFCSRTIRISGQHWRWDRAENLSPRGC